jgi:hypothetical protein
MGPTAALAASGAPHNPGDARGMKTVLGETTATVEEDEQGIS